MKIPKDKVRIGVHEYKIIMKHVILENGNELDGLCDHEASEITLSDKLEGTKLDETFIHECLHAIEETYKIKLGEKKVNALAPAIPAFLTDNNLIKGVGGGKRRVKGNN